MINISDCTNGKIGTNSKIATITVYMSFQLRILKHKTVFLNYIQYDKNTSVL